MTTDYANTGRPILFFTYDLEAYEEEIRGFYVDFEATVPGPLLRTTDEVAEALRDPDAVRAAHAERYDAFVADVLRVRRRRRRRRASWTGCSAHETRPAAHAHQATYVLPQYKTVYVAVSKAACTSFNG